MNHTQNSEFSDVLLDQIADQLSDNGYLIIKDVLDQQLLQGLRLQAHALADQQWKNAGIGRANNHQIDLQVRSDKIHWITGNDQLETNYLALMNSLRIGLNRRLYLGLHDYECHFSLYRKDMLYKKHIDALKGKSNRILSSVLYLNEGWSKTDGGELLIHSETDSHILARVTPNLGTLVMFLSEQFPHQVLPAQKARYSIAGWFREARD